MRATLFLLGAVATLAFLMLGFTANARLCRTTGASALPEAAEAQLCPAVSEVEPVPSPAPPMGSPTFHAQSTADVSHR